MSLYFVDFENVHSEGMMGIENLPREDKVFIFYSEHAATLTFDMHRRIMDSEAEIFYVEIETGSKNALDFQLVSYLGYMLRENPDIPYRVISRDRGFDVVTQFWRGKGIDVEMVPKLIEDLKKRKNTEMKKLAQQQADIRAINAQEEIVEQVKPEEVFSTPLEQAPIESAPADAADKKPKQPKKKNSRQSVKNGSQPTTDNGKKPVENPSPATTAVESVTEFLERVLENSEEREFVAKCIHDLSTKSGINNRIVKQYGTTRAGEIYRLIKPLLKDKKGR